MDDLISRQVVLDWLNDEWDGMVLSVFDGIRALPSAQPEPLTVNFAREMDRETIEKLKEGLKNAPVLIMAVNDSAQSEIIRCEDCKLFGDPKCMMYWEDYDWAEPDGFCHMAVRKR